MEQCFKLDCAIGFGTCLAEIMPWLSGDEIDSCACWPPFGFVSFCTRALLQQGRLAGYWGKI